MSLFVDILYLFHLCVENKTIIIVDWIMSCQMHGQKVIITEACRKNKICCMHVNMVDTLVLTAILEYVHALYSRTLPTLFNICDIYISNR